MEAEYEYDAYEYHSGVAARRLVDADDFPALRESHINKT